MIEIQKVSKHYNRKKVSSNNKIKSILFPQNEIINAINDFSLEVSSKQIIGLIGENGAGKTTLLKMICGILSPNSGTIKILGKNPILMNNQLKKQISVIFGNKNQLWWDLPPKDSFLMTKALYEIADDQYYDDLNNLVSVMGITEFIHTPVRELSLGQRMRCELVNSLVFRPKIILLDEPTLGLDAKSQSSIRNYIKYYIDTHDACCIITSHYIKDITLLATDVVILNGGNKILQSSTPNFIKMCSEYSIIHFSCDNIRELESKINYQVKFTNGNYYIFVQKKEINKVINKLIELNISDIHVSDSEIEDLLENNIISNIGR